MSIGNLHKMKPEEQKVALKEAGFKVDEPVEDKPKEKKNKMAEEVGTSGLRKELVDSVIKQVASRKYKFKQDLQRFLKQTHGRTHF